MPPGAQFPIPPFQWPHIGRQWPTHNVESGQADGLDAWWPTLASYKGNKNILQDFSGNGHHAVIEANAAWLHTPQLGLALDTSADGAAIVPEGNTLDPPEGSITLSAWVYYGTSEPDRVIIGKRDVWSIGGQRWFWRFNYTDVKFTSTQGDINFSGKATVGALVLYTLTDDGTNSRLYKNGLLVETGNSLTFDNDTGSKVAIGKTTQTNTYIDGWLADPRIYRRVFTPTQCWQLFDPYTRWELHQIPRRLWRLGVVAPPPTVAALPIFSSPDAIHSQVFGGVTVR